MFKFRYGEFMQISALKTLVAISRVGSFSRAAELQNMTLSALSMQMKALEADLGVALFDRAFRPPKLTPLGRRVAEDAFKVVEAEAGLRRRCVDRDEVVGTLQIGFVPSMAVRVLPHFLAVAKTNAPNATFEIVTDLSENLSAMVQHGQLDAALVTGVQETGSELNSSTVAQEDLVIVVPASYAAGNLRDIDRTLTFFHFMPHSGIGKLIQRLCKGMEIGKQEVVWLDSIEAIMNCVVQGLGYSFLPRPDVERYGGDGVRLLDLGTKAPVRELSLVTRTDAVSDLWRPHLTTLLLTCFDKN